MNLTDKISKHLIYHDVIKSETAVRKNIDNSCPEALLPNAIYWATNVYDPIKDKFPNAGVYSFFRSKRLNSAVGGSLASYHSYAGAGDIDSPGNLNNRDIFKYVIDDNVPYNEVIWEFGDLNQPDWVHVGLLKGYTIKKIIHMYYQGDKKIREVLTKEQAYNRFKL